MIKNNSNCEYKYEFNSPEYKKNIENSGKIVIQRD